MKLFDLASTTSQQFRNGRRRAIAGQNPDDLRRCTPEKTEVTKVIVLRNDQKTVITSILPNQRIRRSVQPQISHVGTSHENVDEAPNQFGR